MAGGLGVKLSNFTGRSTQNDKKRLRMICQDGG
jgi:hypothetical protein